MSFEQFASGLGSLLPATVLVAIVLFLVREVLELRRRRRADRRRLDAIKHLLSREAEVNFFAASSLRNCLHMMDEWVGNKQLMTLSVRMDAAGNHHLARVRADGGESRSALRGCTDAVLQKHLLDIATLDRTLFAAAEGALDQVLEMRHVKDSLVSYVLDDEERGSWHVDGFPSYGLRQVENTESALKRLYEVCTGKVLTKGRVR